MLSFLFFAWALFSASFCQTQPSIQFQEALKPPTLPYHTIELHGNFSLGYYYATLFLGTPPQKQSFIIDTGSTIFAIPCNMCTSCGLRHMNPKFDVTRSNTSRMITCESGFCRCDEKQKNGSCKFKVNYAEGSSLNGVMVEDVIIFENLEKVEDKQAQKSKEKSMDFDKNTNMKQYDQGKKEQKVEETEYQNDMQLHHKQVIEVANQSVKAIFGCITEETHLFLSQKADGILGLGPIQISNLLEQLKVQHSPTSQEQLAFSICYADNGGIFTIGGKDPRLMTDNPVAIKYRQNNGRYSLGIDDILIGGKSLNLTTLEIFSGEGIVLDSGATFTYFQRQHYKTIVNQIDSVCEQLGCKPYAGEDSKCYHFPTQYNGTEIAFQDQLGRFPSIDIKHGNKKLEWPSKNYFLVRNQIKREACLGFLEFRTWILGSTWMLGREINFNLDKKTITVSNSSCSYDPDYSPPKFHKMYASDRSLLTDLFLELPHHLLIGILTIVIVLILLGVIVMITLKVMKKQSRKGVIMDGPIQSIEMIEEPEDS